MTTRVISRSRRTQMGAPLFQPSRTKNLSLFLSRPSLLLHLECLYVTGYRRFYIKLAILQYRTSYSANVTVLVTSVIKNACVIFLKQLATPECPSRARFFFLRIQLEQEKNFRPTSGRIVDCFTRRQLRSSSHVRAFKDIEKPAQS